MNYHNYLPITVLKDRKSNLVLAASMCILHTFLPFCGLSDILRCCNQGCSIAGSQESVPQLCSSQESPESSGARLESRAGSAAEHCVPGGSSCGGCPAVIADVAHLLAHPKESPCRSSWGRCTCPLAGVFPSAHPPSHSL